MKIMKKLAILLIAIILVGASYVAYQNYIAQHSDNVQIQKSCKYGSTLGICNTKDTGKSKKSANLANGSFCQATAIPQKCDNNPTSSDCYGKMGNYSENNNCQSGYCQRSTNTCQTCLKPQAASTVKNNNCCSGLCAFIEGSTTCECH